MSIAGAAIITAIIVSILSCGIKLVLDNLLGRFYSRYLPSVDTFDPSKLDEDSLMSFIKTGYAGNVPKGFSLFYNGNGTRLSLSIIILLPVIFFAFFTCSFLGFASRGGAILGVFIAGYVFVPLSNYGFSNGNKASGTFFGRLQLGCWFWCIVLIAIWVREAR